ncbi:C19orf48 isoform 4 [Pan troglodytes]|uniref:C19orf48 isoform 3 n=1 Tax=Pan troglodytes TaxID=9598 RepID=A0A2J8IL18_PANTR|nr:C19orf48 isoform 3 [Pan troglodytes]PNI11212.1 C19orf48 isoform 4 [Pan troglodytes]
MTVLEAVLEIQAITDSRLLSMVPGPARPPGLCWDPTQCTRTWLLSHTPRRRWISGLPRASCRLGEEPPPLPCCDQAYGEELSICHHETWAWLSRTDTAWPGAPEVKQARILGELLLV